MSPLNWPRLTLLAAVMGGVAWVLTRMLLTSGRTPMEVPWTVLVVALGAAGVALALGWGVRQYRKGKNPGLSALRAARTVVFAQACGWAGSIITGAYAGYGFAVALEWSHSPRREVAISALVAAASGVVLVIAGIIAEHWCRADHDDKSKQAPA